MYNQKLLCKQLMYKSKHLISSIVSPVEFFVLLVHRIAPSATIVLRDLIIIALGLAIVLENETTDIFTSSLYH